jgi:tetratricopeptide (TPR) repeat protein
MPQQASHPWRRHIWCVAALWVLTFAAYSNCFRAGLVFDSAPLILEDSRVHDATSANVRLIFTGSYWSKTAVSGLYRPLTSLTYLFNYSVLGNGSNPEGYHSINVLLHCLNVSLVYLLGLRIFREFALSLSLSMLWAVHPLLVESVTNVIGRADLLAAFAVLAGLLCYAQFLSGDSATDSRRRAAWLVALVSLQVIGLLSKENAAILPGILLVYDLAWPECSTLRRRLPVYTALILVLAAFFYLRHELKLHVVVDPTENPLVTEGFWSARLTAVKVIGKFVSEFVWPARLSADYSFAAIPLFSWHLNRWEDAKAILTVIICLAALALAVKVRWTNKPLAFFTGFFFISLLPTSNLIFLIGAIMAERFIYLPSIGLAGWVVCAGYSILRRFGFHKLLAERAIVTSASLAAVILATVTYARNSDWQDELSLWTSAVNTYPQSARPHNNRGQALSRIPGRSSDAVAEFNAAIQIRPDYALAHYNLGTALLQTQTHLPEAISEFEAAARLAPDLWEAHYNLGNAYAGLPDGLPGAVREFKAAIRIKPDLAEGHRDLGRVLAMSGRLTEAVAEFQAALRYGPLDADVHYNLGNTLERIPNRLPEAIQEWEAAVRIQPDLAEAHYHLGNALSSMPGRLPEAIAELQTTVRLRPDIADARYALACALVQIPGRQQEAVTEFEAAVRIMPDAEEQRKFNRLRDQVARGRHGQ